MNAFALLSALAEWVEFSGFAPLTKLQIYDENFYFGPNSLNILR
jgi:hypothetical protein